MNPTPTASGLPLRRGDFATLSAGLDYAARGHTGVNFYSSRGELARPLPYAELRERAVALARGLIRSGLPRRARLLLIADTDPDFVITFFACQYAGIIPVPVAVPTSLGGRSSYIATLRRQLISSGAILATGPEGLLPYLREAADGLGVTIAAPAELCALPGEGADLRLFGAADPAYLQYSSGSTRFPLGVDVSQASLMSNVHAIANAGLDVVPGDRSASWLPLYHDMGLVGFTLTPMLCQMSLDLLAPRDFARRPLLWLTLLSRNQGSLSFSPSFGYDLCSRRGENGISGRLDLTPWRAAGIGGDMIQPRVLSRFAEVFAPHGFRPTAFVPSYGMAEATLAISFSALGQGVRVDPIVRESLTRDHVAVPAGARGANGGASDDESVREFVVCGEPLPGHAVEIRDDDGRPLPERRVGRIFVRGPSVTAGYFGSPEATAAVFKDGWLDTGDLGYMVGGAVTITGRSKDLIIINGRNIWPQDLEWAAEQLPGMRHGDTAAFAVEEPDGADKVVLLVQCRTSDPVARAQLIRQAQGVVREAAAVDCHVVLVPPRSLPLTSSGKLSRTRAKADFLSGAYGTADQAPGHAASQTRASVAQAGAPG